MSCRNLPYFMRRCVPRLMAFTGIQRMAGITLEQANAQLASYLAAETAVLANQSYEIAGRKLSRANLAEIQAGITLWDGRCKTLAARTSAGGRGRSRTIVAAG